MNKRLVLGAIINAVVLISIGILIGLNTNVLTFSNVIITLLIIAILILSIALYQKKNRIKRLLNSMDSLHNENEELSMENFNQTIKIEKLKKKYKKLKT